jgi:hypothetical protein
VRAVVVDDHDVIVAMGRKRRLFTGRAREAVLMRSERCVYAGCDRPAARCEADHIDEYQHGGRTDPTTADQAVPGATASDPDSGTESTATQTEPGTPTDPTARKSADPRPRVRVRVATGGFATERYGP